MNIILLGPPGAGKGTMSEYLRDEYNLVHISTGDLLRAEIKAGTDLGKQAKELIENGSLVPDDVIIGMLKKRMSEPDVAERGALLDGFPRTIAQADALKEFCKIDLVLYLKITRDLLVERILARRICADCGEVYSTLWHESDKCNKCGGKLVVRGDDNEETIRHRINTYKESTLPLVDYYEKIIHLEKIDATMSIPEEVETIKGIIDSLK